jgi:hypothetical protein
MLYLVGYFEPFKGTSLNNLMHLPAVVIIHLIADEITRRHGPNDPRLTTVRINSEDKEDFPGHHLIFRFYAFY